MAIQVKICGITNLDDALAATDAGADAIGFNFFSQSHRFVTPAVAQQIVAKLTPSILKVGVFVNASADEIADIVSQVGLDAIQLHGDEPPSLLPHLPVHVPIIRAHRCGANGLAPVERYLKESHALGRLPTMVLIDADAGAAFGGSGELADWAVIKRERTSLGGLPMLLAGGLTPENVASVIEAVPPNGVDVASGVESSPGKKDHGKVREFVAAARAAFTRI